MSASKGTIARMLQHERNEARDRAALLQDQVTALRGALRKLAIKRHVRMVSGGDTIPNGGSCALCKTEWRNGQPESHSASCLLACTQSASSNTKGE